MLSFIYRRTFKHIVHKHPIQ